MGSLCVFCRVTVIVHSLVFCFRLCHATSCLVERFLVCSFLNKFSFSKKRNWVPFCVKWYHGTWKNHLNNAVSRWFFRRPNRAILQECNCFAFTGSIPWPVHLKWKWQVMIGQKRLIFIYIFEKLLKWKLWKPFSKANDMEIEIYCKHFVLSSSSKWGLVDHDWKRITGTLRTNQRKQLQILQRCFVKISEILL